MWHKIEEQMQNMRCNLLQGHTDARLHPSIYFIIIPILAKQMLS